MNKTVNNFKVPPETTILIIFTVFALVIVEFFQLDFVIADWIYQPTSSWYYRDHWITNLAVHRIGKYILILLYLTLLLKFLFRNKSNDNSWDRYGKIVLLSSVLLGTLTVSTLKHYLNADCPWDLLQYGGSKPFMPFFNYDTSSFLSSHCFPSGHASSAFTWISLYFYTSIYYPKVRLKILAALLIVGFGFGLSQQFRGAHFISHDLYSLLVCIIVNIVIYKIAFRKTKLLTFQQSNSDQNQ